jgi:hypothetical protein
MKYAVSKNSTFLMLKQVVNVVTTGFYSFKITILKIQFKLKRKVSFENTCGPECEPVE